MSYDVGVFNYINVSRDISIVLLIQAAFSMDPEDSKLDDPKDSRLDPDDSKVDPDDSRLDPSSKKRALESEGREEDKKRHNSEKLSDESPLASPSFAEWDSSDSETELEEYYIPNQLIIWNLHDETVKRDM